MAEQPLPRVRVPHPHVRCEIRILNGSPHVEGSRVPVRRLWLWYRGGASVETLVKRYPQLGPGRIPRRPAFAYDNLDVIESDVDRERDMLEKKGKPPVGIRPFQQMALPFDGDDEE